MTQLDFEIICYKARGIADEKKRQRIFNYLKKKSPTNAIISIQESHSDKDSEKLWRYQWRDEIYFSHGTKSSRGILIAFRNGLEFNPIQVGGGMCPPPPPFPYRFFSLCQNGF